MHWTYYCDGINGTDRLVIGRLAYSLLGLNPQLFHIYRNLIQKNESGLTKSIQHIENYLWFNDMPVTLQDNIVPEYYENDNFPNPIEFENSTIVNHPIISASINKLSHYEIEQRLKREKLKPKLKLNYNPLLATTETTFSLIILLMTINLDLTFPCHCC